MKERVVQNISYQFAVNIILVYKELVQQSGYIFAKQIVRSGTSIGAMIREADHAESKPDFRHKLAIAQKETSETLYWLELLNETGYLGKANFQKLHIEALSIMKLLTKIIKTSKLRSSAVK
ncbi:MAG: four helix bundle protein [Bacteroidia bacterium]|jgi:four helix bundle protein